MLLLLLKGLLLLYMYLLSTHTVSPINNLKLKVVREFLHKLIVVDTRLAIKVNRNISCILISCCYLPPKKNVMTSTLHSK